MDNIFDMFFDIFNMKPPKLIARNTIGDYIINTVDTPDYGLETGICKNNQKWIIVHRYKTINEAKAGHVSWCAACTLNPIKAWSVQSNQYEEF